MKMQGHSLSMELRNVVDVHSPARGRHEPLTHSQDQDEMLSTCSYDDSPATGRHQSATEVLSRHSNVGDSCASTPSQTCYDPNLSRRTVPVPSWSDRPPLSPKMQTSPSAPDVQCRSTLSSQITESRTLTPREQPSRRGDPTPVSNTTPLERFTPRERPTTRERLTSRERREPRARPTIRERMTPREQFDTNPQLHTKVQQRQATIGSRPVEPVLRQPAISRTMRDVSPRSFDMRHRPVSKPDSHSRRSPSSAALSRGTRQTADSRARSRDIGNRTKRLQ